MSLTPESRSQILESIRKLVLKHHINVAGANYDEWTNLVAERKAELLTVDKDGFESGVRQLLSKLGSSHTTFYHERPNRFLPQHTINATLQSLTRNGKGEWMFLDVFEDGPAHAAGIKPGDLLLAVDGTACEPSSIPTFGIGLTHRLGIGDVRGQNTRDIEIQVPSRKGTKRRPPIIEPKSLAHTMIGPSVGLLRIAYFPGAFGMGFARALDTAITDLKEHGCDRLIIDLRGNIGGSLGFARLASYMCPGRVPIGHSLTPQRLRTGYDREKLPPVPMPSSRAELLFTLARFSFRDKSVVLLTQGLGPQPFHNKIVVLVNEWTNSAAEMAASFAAENRLATVVGKKTAGNVLGAMNFKVGEGYWLRLPIIGWYTSQGQCIEGNGVCPGVPVDISPEALANGQDNQFAKASEIVRSL